MIELGEMVIQDQEHLCESRELVFSMATDLTLSEEKATQLAAIISEIATRSLKENNTCQCQFGVEAVKHKTAETALCVMVSCEDLDVIANNLPIDQIFDESDLITQQNNRIERVTLTAKIYLPWFHQISDQLFLSQQRRRFENLDTIIKQEVLSALGTFVAGAAHELNNPLMGILNYIQYCLKHTDPEDKRTGILNKAERETLRCIRIIEDLLQYSRGDKMRLDIAEKVDVAVLIKRALDLIDYRIQKESVECLTEMPSTPVLITMHADNLEQILLNLLTNAIDALNQRPTKRVVIRLSSTEEFCIIEVEDTGCGIETAMIKHIFTPFYTAKKIGKNTGLGMSICLRIINDRQGKIEVASKLGQGTTVKIKLPLWR